MLDILLQFLELFEWSKMSIAEKSDILRNLGFIFSAIIGVFFLAWRAITNDRIARAALKQTIIATGQLAVANKNVELQTKQVDATNEQIQLLSKSYQATTENNIFSHFLTVLTGFAEANNDINRIVSITLVGEVAKTNVKFLYPTLHALCNYAKAASPPSELNAKLFKILPHVEDNDIKGKIDALKRLPQTFWFKMKPGLGHLNLFEVIQSLDNIDEDVTENQRTIVNHLWKGINNLHPSSFSPFSFEKVCKAEIQVIIDVLGSLKITYPNAFIPLSEVKLDGCDLSARNFSHSVLNDSSLRGSQCYQTDFSNIIASGCDFQSAFLDEANFTNANLTLCDFNGCRLFETNFNGANVRGGRFTNCLGFDKSQLQNAENVQEAIFDT